MSCVFSCIMCDKEILHIYIYVWIYLLYTCTKLNRTLISRCMLAKVNPSFLVCFGCNRVRTWSYTYNTGPGPTGPGPTGPGPGQGPGTHPARVLCPTRPRSRSHPARIPGPSRGPRIRLGPRIRCGLLLIYPIVMISNVIESLIINIPIPYSLFPFPIW